MSKMIRCFLFFSIVLGATHAFARIGGGEHFDSGRSAWQGGGNDGSGAAIQLILWLILRHPMIGIPTAIIVALFWFAKQRRAGDASTRKAFDRAASSKRTSVSPAMVESWVRAIQTKDAQFKLADFLDGVRTLFLKAQNAWFQRDLQAVRHHLSDATFQRLATQLKILELQGVRDAIADSQVLDLQLIGLEQTGVFDTVHIRVKAQQRDVDAPTHVTADEAHALAIKAPLEAFTEVWSFVRKPGALTKPGQTTFQGVCPNCGAPFAGGASNTCEFCNAIVNSGTYDWVLAEITQGSEYTPSHQTVEGLLKIRQADPGFSTEILEDRASLAFWKWVEAQVFHDASHLSKLASPSFLEAISKELEKKGMRKVLNECSVGAAHVFKLSTRGDVDTAAIEIRWSAKVGMAADQQPMPKFPSQPQRWMMVLQRKAGAQTTTHNGMATNRCPHCHAPLADNGQISCEYCGTTLASGEKDWVILQFTDWEYWCGQQYGHAAPSSKVPDRDERERLLYLMAAMATADGSITPKEHKLLRMTAKRWSIPWANVELALNAGPHLFTRLLDRGSAEAEAFLKELVQIALVDGKIDVKEKRMLHAAARHLDLNIDGFLPQKKVG